MLNKKRGFTLVELMITVAIIAIIATIALPSYQESIRKSQRAEAHAGLVKMQLEIENHRMTSISYADSTFTLPTSVSSTYNASNCRSATR